MQTTEQDPAHAADTGLVLVTGAAGYIGSSLLRHLAGNSWRIRASARTPSRIANHPGVERVAGEALDPTAVRASLEGVHTAFYLVHTLGGGTDYAQRDRDAAAIFAHAAAEAGVRRIIYLGGLGGAEGTLSEHLASRQEVGRTLASSGVPVIEFRASIVIGGGSTSFEMIRNLTEKLPVMTTPRWVRMPAQPISIDDVVAYLTAAITVDLPADVSHRIYEIGGADIVTYGGLLSLYAERRGLKRLVIPVPLLSPGLSGWWLYLFTPKQATVGRQLAESLRWPTVVTDEAAVHDFPQIRPVGAADAVDMAFAAEDARYSEMCWSQELGDVSKPQHLKYAGRYIDSRLMLTHCPPGAAFDPVACIGGENGWYAYDTLWDLRGAVDLLLGGPGRRRGRRDQYALAEGDHLEWWVVEKVESPKFLRLRAEMVLPGRGWLQYELTPVEDGTLVRQTALFDAKGLLGRAYWYAVVPFHHFVFNGTLKGIEKRCRELVEGPDTCPLPGGNRRDATERQDQGAEE